jgi:ribonuclease VapC
LGQIGLERPVALLDQQAIVTVACDQELTDSAAAAFQRFGRGRHPRALNFRDCCSYARAHRLQVPLLFVASDFSSTDLQAAL